VVVVVVVGFCALRFFSPEAPLLLTLLCWSVLYYRICSNIQC